MKKVIFILLCTAFNLEATHYHSSMSVTPTNSTNTNEYRVEIQLEKITDGASSPEIIATPILICSSGQPAQCTLESTDKTDLLSIQVMVLENATEKGVQATFLIKEEGKVVLSFDNHTLLKS